MKLYVGNLPHRMTEQELKDVFAEFGTVDSASIIKDKFTGQSRGFGFVEMEQEAAQAALANLDNKEVMGRDIRVSKAHPQNAAGAGRTFGGPRGGPRGGMRGNGPNGNRRGGNNFFR